jgi:peroxiredoxin
VFKGLRKAARLRAKEQQWQQEYDCTAPKVGDQAPDFTLFDPSGEQAVTLSSFRGQKPVALVFGSST